MPADNRVKAGILDWDFQDKHVDANIRPGAFISSQSVLLAAGPPELRGAARGSRVTDLSGQAGDIVYPLGVVETFALSEGQQVNRLFEIGSSRSYFVPGRVVGTLQLGRVLVRDTSLLRALFAYYGGRNTKGRGGFDFDPLISSQLGEEDQQQFLKVTSAPGTPGPDKQGGFFVTMNSEVMLQPFGLFCYVLDQSKTPVAGFYIENCILNGHSMGWTAGNPVIIEGASAEFDRIVPVRVLGAVGAAATNPALGR